VKAEWPQPVRSLGGALKAHKAKHRFRRYLPPREPLGQQ
jgi:hypothetical protein